MVLPERYRRERPSGDRYSIAREYNKKVDVEG
jgi:hypothetical protein